MMSDIKHRCVMVKSDECESLRKNAVIVTGKNNK